MTDHNVQATVVTDSIAPSGIRLTTMLLTYPTIIHQDILTHRTMYKLDVGEEPLWMELDSNKSTNSNRAKPTKQVLYEVWSNPFCPTKFPKRAASMHSSQGHLEGWRHQVSRFTWLKLRYGAIAGAIILMKLPGVHKQIANRLLMPWLYTTLVVTAIDKWWLHFFNLRAHYAAQDEVQQVAKLAKDAYTISAPDKLALGDWHLPFVAEHERYQYTEESGIALSVARCARTSYARSHAEMLARARMGATHEDLDLFKRLDVQTPEHAGPKEHQAQAMSSPTYVSGTLVGWHQLRHHDAMAVRLKRLYQLPHPEHGTALA